jgi:hypothetical protein
MPDGCSMDFPASAAVMISLPALRYSDQSTIQWVGTPLRFCSGSGGGVPAATSIGISDHARSCSRQQNRADPFDLSIPFVVLPNFAKLAPWAPVSFWKASQPLVSQTQVG